MNESGKNVDVDFVLRLEVLVENGTTEKNRICWVDYSLRSEVLIKYVISVDSNEKRLSLSCFRISCNVLKR